MYEYKHTRECCKEEMESEEDEVVTLRALSTQQVDSFGK